MPAYNAARTLRKTYDEVMSQPIWGDGPYGGTLATLSTYCSRDTSCLPNSLPLMTAF
jgi:hypothetical protein